MRGLKSPENKQFINFFSIVQQEAAKRGCFFFLETGAGRDLILPDYEGEDLSGWLVPIDRADDFEAEWSKFHGRYPVEFFDDDVWGRYFIFEIWEIVGDEIRIDFRTY